MSAYDSYPLTELPDYRISALEQAGPALILASLAAALGTVDWLRRRKGLSLGLAAMFAGLAGALLWIYRNPERQPSRAAKLVLAPGDGHVVSITNIRDGRYVNNSAYLIRIAIGITDVQVMRAPVGGAIGYRRYEPGHPAAGSEPADSNWLGIQLDDRTRVLLRQIASPLWQGIPWQSARRILCWPDLGDQVKPGQVIGHLPLGGHMELYVPARTQVKVRAGQALRGGETVMGEL
jgi:phosphatidylserine decarboxylase